LYLIKSIFEIDNINEIDIIKLDNYDENILFNNLKKNKKIIFSLFDEEFKKPIQYILLYNNYFDDIKNKIISIIKPLFKEEYVDKLFTCDDDLTRLLPIFALILYLYILEEDIEKTIIRFLNINTTFIQFYIISYLIIDNLMDNNNDVNEKNIYFKWFIKLINEPNNHKNLELNEAELNVWQCKVFKKYFIQLLENHPYEENINIYEYLKDMINIIIKSDNLQKDKNISEKDILYESFKKSYSVFYFIILVTHNQLNLDFDKKKIYKLCKLAFLVQLYDDLFDIDKDISENNYTYFNSNNINLDFILRVKKIFNALFVVINELVSNKQIFEFCNFFYKNMIFVICYYLKDELNNNDFLEYTEKYSFFSQHIFSFFDKTSYNILKNKKLINIIKNNF
jgi:hypothetical protein